MIWTPAEENTEDCGLICSRKESLATSGGMKEVWWWTWKICMWKVQLPGSLSWHGPAQWLQCLLSNPSPPLGQPTMTTHDQKFNSFSNWTTKSLILDTSEPARDNVRLGAENRMTDWRLHIERWDSQPSLSSCRMQRESRTSPPRCHPWEGMEGLSSEK